MSKRYYVRYLEARNNLLVHSSSSFVMTISFDVGLRLSQAAGHLRKRDAIRRVEQVNTAAGTVIAEYAGAFEPASRW